MIVPRRAAVTVAALLFAASLPVAAQVPAATAVQSPSLAAARTLYASAEYGGALEMLNGLLGGNPGLDDLQSIDLYRALCLVAQSDMPEATRIIDGMITRDPLYRPASDDVPPRLRAVFTDSRRRLLPGLLQALYSAAKVSFDQKEYAAAAKTFGHVLAGLTDPDMEAVSAQSPLSDLKVLASGFHDLATKAAAPPPEPAPVVAPPPAVAAPPAVAPPAAAAPAAPAPQPVAGDEAEPRVYSAADTNVVPPIIIRQVVPPYPGKVLKTSLSTIEVVIDDTGNVASAVMDVPLSPAYDRIALSAARTWQYQPATVDGRPVRFRKRIQISLVPATAER